MRTEQALLQRRSCGRGQVRRLCTYPMMTRFAPSCSFRAPGTLLAAVLIVTLMAGGAWPGLALAQGGVTYVVQPGDSLGYIAAKYGTTVEAIMQANGLTSPDTVWAGQSLSIPIQAGAPTNAGAGASTYTVALGDTLNSIAASLGVRASDLAAANGITDPDMLYVGQRLLVPGTALGGLAIASPTNARNQGHYVVQPGDTLYNIASALGVTVADLQAANSLTSADLLVVGQRLVIPKPGAQQATSLGTARPSAAAAPAEPLGLGAAAPPGSAPTYVVRPGDTLNAIAERLSVAAADLAKINSLSNADVLSIGQRLLVPGSAPAASSSASGGAAAPQAPSAAARPPDSTRHTVQPGETLGSIASRYNTTAAAIARTNQLSSPDLVSVGMTLVIPSADWTSASLAGQASRFVASISQQHCWLYQGNALVASWTCSTGRPGADSVPGTYRVQSKMDKAFGSAWNIWMPYWLGIYWAGSTENGIHSIPYDADTGAKLWEGSVGTPITFGCVLLAPEHAKQLYDVAYIGMPVIIQP